MGETFWQMRRAQRIRDGLALKSIQGKPLGQQMTASRQALQAMEAVVPFERLTEALSRRGEGPTAEEIGEFAKSRKGNHAKEMQEFIVLLKSLNAPMEEGGAEGRAPQSPRPAPPVDRCLSDMSNQHHFWRKQRLCYDKSPIRFDFFTVFSHIIQLLFLPVEIRITPRD